ncbi:hypothetical protein INS49_004950 [Diaporthe citri]|uniref:uncharacterized protein n=1 Tax=Diaporthe citri TaxID=83186 RepID=UPI001C8058B7|nr:uncharacterized protein INS49_004950 [Diaporthe citri]KAG6353979.1 hypothetical protein INS49_004950 [Diaporthe citri]
MSDDGGWSWFPDTKANDQAKWRRTALAKRANVGGTTAENTPNPKGNVHFQLNGNTSKPIDGFDECRESLVAASAANENSHSTQASEVSQGPGIVYSPGNLVENISAAPEVSPVRSERPSPGSKPFLEDQARNQRDRASQELQPTMAESLNAITEKFLNIDVLDQRQDVSRYMAYLLDAIDMLGARINFLEAKDTDSRKHPTSQLETPRSPGRHTDIFVGKVLHRVTCSNRNHHHPVAYYEDKPTYRDRHSGGEGKLMGDKIVHSLDDYLGLRSKVSFLVVHDHSCTGHFQSDDRTFEDNHRRNLGPNKENLRVVAPLLQEALLKVAEYSPIQGLPLAFLRDQGMGAPYPFLFHHHKKLVELAREEIYEGVLRPLLDFLATNYRKEYEEANSLFEAGVVKSCHLTKLFKPNQMVISRSESNVLQACILYSCVILQRGKVLFQGWSFVYDGNGLKRNPWVQEIDGLLDERIRIADLKVHPAKFARPEDIEYLEKRGRRFWSMRNQTYICYTGWDKARLYHYAEERFMVDMATYKLMHPFSNPSGAVTAELIEDQVSVKLDPWPRKVDKTEELSDKAAMILPSTIFGFRLQAKKWINLLVDNFHSIKWHPEAFGRLVLDDSVKKMIYALINVQKSAGRMDDIIAGKGNGLIILLHGSPGTGKTLTAESVAEIAEKPLYRVTCGDIGTDPKDVENYLETVLYLGKTWDCVLLLDEADVFLEERTMADLQRNSLVSIFLRTLEYYDGILILTSNRVGTFDEAFKSRIQVAIHYESLTKKSRRAIWRNFFDMIEESEDEDANMAELERRLDELAAHEMNGRQIRNALLTARQLAKHEGERLDWKHLNQAMKTAADFNKYLKTVKGHSDDQWAREEMLR